MEVGMKVRRGSRVQRPTPLLPREENQGTENRRDWLEVTQLVKYGMRTQTGVCRLQSLKLTACSSPISPCKGPLPAAMP